MDRTKGGTVDLLHARMDHLSLDMPHAARNQYFEVSNGSSHFAEVIPSWDLMIYNGFYIYDPPYMESIYFSPNMPPRSTFISLCLVPSLSYAHLVFKPFFTVTMSLHRCQAHFERHLGPYSDLRTCVVTTFRHYPGHVSQDIHVGLDKKTNQLGPELNQIPKEKCLKMWGTWDF